jgi:hypothetical protein
MYHGHDYEEPKAAKDYLDWRADRYEQLAAAGIADAHQIADDEATEHMLEQYAAAAQGNRRINLLVQRIMIQAQRTVLWLTLVLAVQAILYVALVTIG